MSDILSKNMRLQLLLALRIAAKISTYATPFKSQPVSLLHLDQDIQVITSKDGITFNQAVFDDSDPESIYMVNIMESSSTSIILQLSKDNGKSRLPKFGSVCVSNDNGTDFRLALKYTNEDLAVGLTDFERIGAKFFDGIIGWIIMNRNHARKRCLQFSKCY